MPATSEVILCSFLRIPVPFPGKGLLFSSLLLPPVPGRSGLFPALLKIFPALRVLGCLSFSQFHPLVLTFPQFYCIIKSKLCKMNLWKRFYIIVIIGRKIIILIMKCWKCPIHAGFSTFSFLVFVSAAVSFPCPCRGNINGQEMSASKRQNGRKPKGQKYPRMTDFLPASGGSFFLYSVICPLWGQIAPWRRFDSWRDSFPALACKNAVTGVLWRFLFRPSWYS